MVKELSRENVQIAAMYVDSRPRNEENAKGSCTEVAPMATVRAIQAIAVQTKHAISEA